MRLFIVLAVGAATLALPSTAAAEETDPVAGCPAGKELLTIEETVKIVDYSVYPTEPEREEVESIIRSLDESGNNDDYLCSKQFKPNRGQDKHWGADDYVITQISDNQPRGRL